MKKLIENILFNLLTKLGLQDNYVEHFQTVSIWLGIFFLCWFMNFFTKKVIHVIIVRIVQKSKNSYDDIFLEQNVFSRLSHLIPAIFLHYIVDIFFPDQQQLLPFLHKIINIYVVIAIFRFLMALLNALQAIYDTFPIAKQVPIKGYAQIVKIIFYSICIIWIFSNLIGISIGKVFTAMGAAAAVLLLVFKDTILGLVASIQLTANNMIKIGDAISVPKYNADGVVMDINITTIKLRNSNYTVTCIPTYSLITESFINNTSLEQTPGRQIKKSILIDFESLRILEDSDITFLKNRYFTKFSNQNVDLQDKEVITNIELFRNYIESYFLTHPLINVEHDMIIKQLTPTDKGLPLEIIAFCNEKAPKIFETCQMEIFEHLYSIMGDFKLKIFQSKLM